MRFTVLLTICSAKNLTASERNAKDSRILGAFGLSWAILQSTMPKAVTDACDDAIQASGMSPMAYKTDNSGVVFLSIHYNL